MQRSYGDFLHNVIRNHSFCPPTRCACEINTWPKRCGGNDGEEHSQNRQEVAAQNRCEVQTLPLRQVSQAKPQARQDAGSVVLPHLS